MTTYRAPMVEQNSAGEWVAWLHDGPTVGIYADEPAARRALAARTAHEEETP